MRGMQSFFERTVPMARRTSRAKTAVCPGQMESASESCERATIPAFEVVKKNSAARFPGLAGS